MAQGPEELPISLDNVTEDNLMLLMKKLNASIFPASGNVLASDITRNTDKYYADVLASGEFTKLAYYDGNICVGAIASQLEKKKNKNKNKKKDGPVRVYIMSIGVLVPYRRLGIGTRLLNHVVELSSKENASEVYLHLQTNNKEAMKFFKKCGFRTKEMALNYFNNTASPDCNVLTQHLSSKRRTDMASASKTDEDETSNSCDSESESE